MVQTIEIESDINKIKNVELFFTAIFKKLNFSRKIYGKIYLAGTEAVNNAILHGNKENITKRVKITFQELEEIYQLIISDEGNGFDYEQVPDPCDPANLIKESGRGIFIMKQYASAVSFLNGGSTVILSFNKQ